MGVLRLECLDEYWQVTDMILLFLGKTFAFIKQGESTKVPNYQNARGCALMATTHLGGRPGSHGR